MLCLLALMMVSRVLRIQVAVWELEFEISGREVWVGDAKEMEWMDRLLLIGIGMKYGISAWWIEVWLALWMSSLSLDSWLGK